MALVAALGACRESPAVIEGTPPGAALSAPELATVLIRAEPTLSAWPPPPLREGIGYTLTGRLVRTGERLPLSPYASWIKEAQSLRVGGSEVVIRVAGSASAVDPAAVKLPHADGGRGEISWMLTVGAGEFTSVLALHESPPYFQRGDYDCADETELLEARTLEAGPRTLVWVELGERWTCRYNGDLAVGRVAQSALTGPLERDRRTALLALIDPGGRLRRLAAGIPLEEKGKLGAKGTLVATLGADGVLSVKAGARGATFEQRKWIGDHALEPIALRAAAVPSPIDEPLLDGDVPPICGQAGVVGKLSVEASLPLAIQPWILNPDVLVLSVPGGGGRIALRAVVEAPNGSLTDVTNDPCLRFQVAGWQDRELGAVSALRPLPQRGTFEGSYLDGESVLVFFRGERRIVRLLTRPVLAPGDSAGQFGIVPMQSPTPRGDMTIAALARALWSGDSAAFAAAAALDRSGKKALAGELLGQLQTTGGDRALGLAALAVVGEPAAEVAVPYLAGLLFPTGGTSARAWRSPREAPAAEAAFERMGDRALDVLVEHLDDDSAGRMAEAIVRDVPALRVLVSAKARGRDGRYLPYSGVALRSAPIETPADMDEAIAMLSEGYVRPEAAIQRIAAAADAPRTPARDLLLARAVPVLARQLSVSSGQTPGLVTQALGRIGPPAISALPILQARLLDPSCPLRAAARSAISAISGRPVRVSEGHADSAVECALGSSPYAIHPAGRARPEAPPDASLPRPMLMVSGLTSMEAGGKRFGFEPPSPVDWQELGRRHLRGITFDLNGKATGPLVEAVRARRESYYDGVVGGDVAFAAPIPAALSKLHFYAVTESGIARIEPRQYEGTARISIADDGREANVRFHGLIGAEVSRNGFVLISDSPIATTPSTDATSLSALWPGVLEGEALWGDEEHAPRGFRFSIQVRGHTEEYVFAILPPDPSNCADRKRLLRLTGTQLRRIAILEEKCDV